MKNNKGFAIISVVSVMFILLIMGLTFVTIAKLNIKKAEAYLGMVKARQYAISGVEYACALISADTLNNLNIDTLKESWADETNEIINDDVNSLFRVDIQDSASKVNVNACNTNETSVFKGVPINDIDINKLGDGGADFDVSNDFTKIFSDVVVLSNSDYDFENDFAPFVCSRSYEIVDNRINLDDIIRGNLITVENINNQINNWQYSLNIKDFFDADNIISVNDEQFGREISVFISKVIRVVTPKGEVSYKIELYNLSDEDIALANMYIESGSSKIKISTENISANNSLNISFPENIIGDVDLIFKNGTDEYVLDTFVTDGGNSLERVRDDIGNKDDPRNGGKIEEGESAKFLNLKSKDKINENIINNFNDIDSGIIFNNSVTDLKRVYADSGHWQYLKLISKDIVYKENVELIERGDLDLYDSFYYFNNLTKDYFDNIDTRTLGESPQRISGKININTAPIEVLMCLPEIDRPAARAIIEYRQVNSFYSIGDVIFALQRVSSFEDNTVDLIFDRISNLITVQSNCFIVNITGIYANRYNYTVTALIDRNLLGNKRSRIVYEQEIL